MEARSYFQTTLLNQDDARSLNLKAQSQENKILSFLTIRHGEYTAEEIRSFGVLHPRTPLTSYRRALTNLSNKGKVIRIRETKGQYGVPVGVYRVVGS